VDFSATPYNEVGTGRNSRKSYFPHIAVDFDLKTAMRTGLVKSLVLDKRSEIGALSHEELDFKADRDENGNPMLSEGQRIMLRAGLTKLRKLEADFAALDPDKHPKMLVVCEDTNFSRCAMRRISCSRRLASWDSASDASTSARRAFSRAFSRARSVASMAGSESRNASFFQ
jgi:hypothetical protein